MITSNLHFLSGIILPFAFLSISLTSCTEQIPESQSRFAETDKLIEAAIEDSLFSGAVLLAGTSEEILHQKAYGHAALFNSDGTLLQDPDTMSLKHLFDIASLTKIYATTFGIMLLHSRGLLDVDKPLSKYIPEFDTFDKRSITSRHLLTHSSGLMQWFPTYYTSENSRERLEFIAEQPLISEPGSQRRYSDLGFMILADLIEVISGTPFTRFLEQEIYSPLELSSTLFNPDLTIIPDITATSHGNPFEKRMVYDDDFGYTVDVDPDSWDGWREYVLRGEVNDGNAFHTHDGMAGHAGLFSTAEELYILTKIMLTGGQYKELQLLRPESLNLFLTRDRFGHGLGFMMKAQSLHADKLPEGSFGHTGFTGTNVVVIPERDLIFILLTNRQHFGVDEDGTYPDLRELRETVLNTILEK